MCLPARAAGGAGAAASQTATKRVLVIYSNERLLPANVIADEAIRKTFVAEPAMHVEFHSEFLDVPRFNGESHEQQQAYFFGQKYAERRPDLIMAGGGPALAFLTKYRTTLFTDIPVVYLGVTAEEVPRELKDPHIVGVPTLMECTSTLELALRLHPRTREVAILAGTSEDDIGFTEGALRELQPFEKRVRFRRLGTRSMADIKTELAGLPDDTLVLYTTMFRDESGETFLPREALAQFAPSSRVPIYGIFDTYVGHGIVGGSVVTFEQIGKEGAEVGKRILSGEEPQAAVRHERLKPVAMFDWKQLRRAGISEDQLPRDSVIRFRDPSLWEEYRWQIIGVVSLCAGEGLLIFALVVQLQRRRRAEALRHESEERMRQAREAANESEMRFLLIANSAPVLIWMSGLDKLCTFFNDSWLYFTGRTLEQELGNGWAEGVHPDDLADCLRIYTEAFDARNSFTMDYRLRRHDGVYRWVSDHGVAHHDNNGVFKGFIGSCVDVTERKASARALETALAELKQVKAQLDKENISLRQEIKGLNAHPEIVGQSPELRRVLAAVDQVARTDSSVLLLGETGTGKELIARAIHNLSPRRDKPMVSVNCAAIPVTLIESELFGREKGAYTGALTRQIGRFEAADGSTLFLDEVGELPPEVQVKLLRVLQEKEIERLGGTKSIPVNIRVVAATNRDLAKAVKEGRFREDLYYRLTVFPIKVPPLRERSQDIPLLVMAFVEHFSKSMGKQIEAISSRSMEALVLHRWPGNVRELRNHVERAMILNTGATLYIERPVAEQGTLAEVQPTLDQVKVTAIVKALERSNWRIRGTDGAAQALGVKPTTLEAMMTKLGIRRVVSNGA